MAELNAAWSVLRSPARRAAYDEELARSARPSGADRLPGEDEVVRGAAVLVPDRAGPAAAPARARQPWGCLLVVVGLVAAALVATAYAASRGGDQVEVRTREPLAEGACVLVGEEAGETVLVEVACSEPHDAEVAARTVFPMTCPTSTVAVLLPDQTTLVCLRDVARAAGGR